MALKTIYMRISTKQIGLSLLVVLMSMTSYKSFAYDLKVKNADGVTIFYNYINDGKALEVTYSAKSKYSGKVAIPKEVTYMERTRKVTSIGEDAFQDCVDLTSVTIPTTVKSIGLEAFAGCTSLTSVKIPSSVKTIGESAFTQCSSLKSVTISNGVTSIGKWAFINTALTSVTLPNSVTTIDENAFEYCQKLKTIKFGTGVTTVGRDALNGCTALKNIYVSDLAAWCNIDFDLEGSLSRSWDEPANPLHLFVNNVEVTELTIPDGVTEIKNSTFYGFGSLTSVTIPNSVTSIGSFAFAWSGLNSITIPSNVKSVGYGCFFNCHELTSVSLPSKLTELEDFVLQGCHALASVKIPSTVKTIGKQAFAWTSLTSVTIPDKVKTIDDEAFENCESLKSVTMGKGVTSIGENAFRYCSALNAVRISDLAAWCNIDFQCPEDNYDYYSNPLVMANHLYLNGTKVKKLAIPDGVTEIKSGAFFGGGDITSLTIPNSVTAIGENTFAACDLSSLTIPNSVTYLGFGSFKFNQNMTSVTIPNSVTLLGGWAFEACFSLTSVTIPNSVTEIYDNTFESCVSLTSVTIPNSVTSIGMYAFAWTGLTSVTIPNSVTSIGESAFTGCSSLTSFTIPYGVTSIGDYAFSVCGSWSYLSIPSSVTSIGTQAFDGTDIAKVYSLIDTPFKIGSATFNKNTRYNATLYVPSGTTDKYKAKTGWKTFKFIEEAAKPKVSLNMSSVTIEKGTTLTLKATVTPKALPDKSVIWTSSDTKVATVTSSGKVKGVKAGTATITCTSVATGAKATCKVTVGYVKLDQTEVSVVKGKTVTLTATVYPSSLTDKSVTWESSDTKIATVTSAGKVKGIKAGTAIITCTSNATGLSTTCTVTVKASSGSRSVDGDDDDVTGINTLQEKSDAIEPFDVYDLSGHKVLQKVTSLDGLPDGVYIVNGKKMLKK